MNSPFLTVSVAALIGSVVTVSGALAQPAAPTPQSQDSRRFSIAIRFGNPSSGPAADIENAMRAAGLDQTSTGLSGRDAIVHPFSATGFGSIGLPVSFDAHYRVTGPWMVGAAYNETPIGETLGYREPFQFLFVQYRVATVAALVGAGWRGLQVSAGPALHTASTKRTSGDPATQVWIKQRRLGYLLQARTVAPTRSRVFFDASFEYRSVGRVSAGPYTVRGAFDSSTTFPRTDVNFDHYFVGVGVGLRF